MRVYAAGGSYVHIEGGNITVVAGTTVTIKAPDVVMTGRLTVAGDTENTGGDVQA